MSDNPKAVENTQEFRRVVLQVLEVVKVGLADDDLNKAIQNAWVVCSKARAKVNEKTKDLEDGNH